MESYSQVINEFELTLGIGNANKTRVFDNSSVARQVIPGQTNGVTDTVPNFFMRGLRIVNMDPSNAVFIGGADVDTNHFDWVVNAFGNLPEMAERMGYGPASKLYLCSAAGAPKVKIQVMR